MLQLSESDFKKFVLPHMTEVISKVWDDINSLHFLYEAHKKFPNVINKKYLKKHLNVEDIICSESLEKLSRLLVSSN